MWEIDIKLQLINLLYSAVLGGFYCLLYDIFRAIRMTVKCSDIAVFIQDILYWSILAPITFCYLMIATNGQIRGYIILGIIIGFIFVRYTVSFILIKIYSLILKGLIWLFSVFTRIKSAVFNRILQIFDDFTKFIKKIFKKGINTLKKLLKKQ